MTSNSGRGRRPIRRPNGPNLRTLGGLVLIAAVALVVFTAHRNATAPPSTSFVIAYRPDGATLPAGHVLTAEDLAMAPMTAGATVTDRLLTSPEQVIGRVLTRTVGSGEPLTATAVAEASARPGDLTLAVRPVAAPDLEAGDPVILYDTGGNDRPATRLTEAVVVGVDRGSAGIGGGGGDRRVVIALADEGPVAEVLSASTADRIALVRPRPTGAGR